MKQLLFIVVLLLCIPVALSDGGYNYTGYTEQTFRSSNLNTFNDVATGHISFSAAIPSGDMEPLVGDLDNDGTNEIVVLSGSSVRIFSATPATSSLTLLDSFSITSDTYMGQQIIDIDGDGYREVIYASMSAIEIVEYNGSATFNQTTHRIGGGANGEIMFRCVGQNDCWGITTGANGQDLLNPLWFDNSTWNTTAGTVYNDVYRTCFPTIKTVAYADYDHDLVNEFIISAIDPVTTGTDESVRVFFFENMTETTAHRITNTDPADFIASAGTSCRSTDWSSGDNFPGKFLSPPLVADIAGSPSDGLDIVIGMVIGDAHSGADGPIFRLYYYDRYDSAANQEPDLFTADGTIMSNVMLMDAYEDTGGNDMCVLGGNGVNIDLLCMTLEATAFGVRGTDSFYSTEYLYSLNGRYNITEEYQMREILSHAVRSKATSPADEVVNSYGVFELNQAVGSFNASDWLHSLDIIFSFEEGEARAVPVDYEVNGLDDFLLLTDTNLFYLDDGFTEAGASIISYTINPCIDSVWKLNTTAQIQMVVQDGDEIEDDVSGNVVAYVDETNEFQTGYSLNVTSGTTITRTFTANKTTTSGIIRMQGRDTGLPGTVDSVDVDFIVSSEGVELNDCTTTVTAGVTTSTSADTVNASLTPTTTDNSIRNSILDLDQDTGLNLGLTVWWLIIMIIAAGGTWGAGMSRNVGGRYTFGTICIMEILLLILGVYLGFIGAGVVISVLIVAIAAIIMFLRSHATGNQ